MPSSQNGNIGLNSGYTAGDNGWTAQHNFNWDALDALTQAAVIGMTTTTPPGSPANGDAYIVPSGATGAWASKTNQIVAWQRGAWAFYVPKNGWQVYNKADGGDYLYNGAAWVLQGSQKLNVPQDYISGLKLIWNSGTSISVGTGSACISSLGRLSQVNAALTLSSLSLSASTAYHVYLYENAGTPTIECVTTAPAAAYYGTARAKTGDTSRRYLGTVVTDGSGLIYNFSMTANGSSGSISYKNSINSAPFAVVSGGSATTVTNVSCAGIVGPSATGATIIIGNLATSGDVTMGTSDMSGTLSATNYLQYVGAGKQTTHIMPLDSSQAFNYFYTSTPSGGFLYIRVAGYIFER